MNLRFFIDRPVFSIVISVVIVLMGIIGLSKLPVELYPEIAPPTVSVFTSYPGANAETVQKAVITPLEQAINGVEGMIYMTSTASNGGDASINVYFKAKTDPDMATVIVQNRVNKALSMLPGEVTKIGITVEKQQNAELKTFAIYSEDDSYDRQFLNNYMTLNIEPRIKRVSGVGNVMQFGSDYSMRIWLKPDRMAQYGLVPADISEVLADQNIEASTGSFGQDSDNAYEYSMKYRGRLSTSEEFGNLVVKALPGGEILRLKDVADVELGDEAYNYASSLNGHEAAMAMIYQTAGTNAARTINEIDDVLRQVEKELPPGLKIVTLTDSNSFLYASIREVVKTLLEAILLVVLIVYVFLQDVRSTVIPAISILVSITGTFAVMALIGFSINLLTLFALVLAIGTVVDDAIVVVEAVQAKFDSDCGSSYLATDEAMRNVSAAILTSTFIFMAVFIPVSFMGGLSGEFYKQFGLTMAIAVGISAINAFTLSPALCALMLRPSTGKEANSDENFASRFRKAFNTAFSSLTHRYMEGIKHFISHKWLSAAVLVIVIALTAVLVRTTRTGLVPDEDAGSIMISLTAKPGTSMSETKRIMEKLDRKLATIPEIAYSSGVAGWSDAGSGSSSGMYFISLKPWSERKGKESSLEAVIDRINSLTTDIPEAEIFVMSVPMISGFGMGSGFEVALQDKMDGDIDDFKKISDVFVEELSKNPAIGDVNAAFKTDYPQFWIDIDPAECESAGISPNSILETMSAYYSGDYVSDFNRFSRMYRVTMQAAPMYRITPESIEHIFVRTAEGEMAPLSRFVRLTKTFGPTELSRFNLYNSISLSGTTAPGHSSGEALDAIRRTAEMTLPSNYGFEFSGISLEESKTGNNVAIILGLCVLLVYLILCSLYESFFVPLAIILSVPCGVFGSFLFTRLAGLENNIYMQTGIIMLVGLLAKTAVLLTEYASTMRKESQSLQEAAMSAAKARLRPILMTALTMVFGLLPLVIAHGVGANGSRSLATGVVGGMMIGTLALLYLIPALWIVFQKIQERFRPTATIPILLTGLLLSSCGAYKEYQPISSVPENLYGIPTSATDTSSLATMDWKEIFKDSCLQSLIEAALACNIDYKTALLRTEQAAASLGAARRAYFPSLGLGAEGNSTRYDRQSSRTYNIGLNASWEIDIFGRLTAAKRGEAAAMVSAEEEAKAVRTQLIATVATSYYSLLMLDRQMEIARNTLDNWTETLRVMELLKSAGMTKETGVLQTKADIAGLQADMSAMERNIREIENSLCSLLARTPCRIVRGSLEKSSFSFDLSLGLPIQLLANRPDVRAAEMELARTHYGVGEARASFYPSLTLSGTVGFTNNGGIVVNPCQWLLNAIGQLAQPIFNRGQIKATYRIAEAEREIARLKFNQVLLDAGKEVNDALADISSARERLSLAEEQIALLDEAVRKTELLMRHSPTSYLEVLTAQQSLLSARHNEAQCRYEETAGIISLYHALGGGK